MGMPTLFQILDLSALDAAASLARSRINRRTRISVLIINYQADSVLNKAAPLVLIWQPESFLGL